MYGVYNNNNVIYARNLNSLINVISDSKWFGFCDSNIDWMIYSFIDRIIIWVNMYYGNSNLILNTSVQDYSDCLQIGQCVENTFIEFVNMYNFVILGFVIGDIKILINLKLRENSLLSELKEEKTALSWLLVSITNFLIFSLCLEVMFLNKSQ